MARQVLPVRPGDLIMFFVSGNRLLVVTSDIATGHPDGRPTTGQWIGGLMSTSHTCEVATMFLDWSGYHSLWNIVRTVP